MGKSSKLMKGIENTQNEMTSESPKTPTEATKKTQAEKSTPKPLKAQNMANTDAQDAQDAQKAVMGFRAPVESITRWRAYAKESGQEIGEWCTAALNAHMQKANLTEEQKEWIEMSVKREMAKKS